eukprot:jgi/Mesvir1/29531/Mv14934-RA.1
MPDKDSCSGIEMNVSHAQDPSLRSPCSPARGREFPSFDRSRDDGAPQSPREEPAVPPAAVPSSVHPLAEPVTPSRGTQTSPSFRSPAVLDPPADLPASETHTDAPDAPAETADDILKASSPSSRRSADETPVCRICLLPVILPPAARPSPDAVVGAPSHCSAGALFPDHVPRHPAELPLEAHGGAMPSPGPAPASPASKPATAAFTLGCRCAGSLAVSHQGCALHWFVKTKRSPFCEICGHEVAHVTALVAKLTSHWRRTESGGWQLRAQATPGGGGEQWVPTAPGAAPGGITDHRLTGHATTQHGLVEHGHGLVHEHGGVTEHGQASRPPGAELTQAPAGSFATQPSGPVMVTAAATAATATAATAAAASFPGTLGPAGTPAASFPGILSPQRLAPTDSTMQHPPPDVTMHPGPSDVAMPHPPAPAGMARWISPAPPPPFYLPVQTILTVDADGEVISRRTVYGPSETTTREAQRGLRDRRASLVGGGIRVIGGPGGRDAREGGGGEYYYVGGGGGAAGGGGGAGSGGVGGEHNPNDNVVHGQMESGIPTHQGGQYNYHGIGGQSASGETHSVVRISLREMQAFLDRVAVENELGRRGETPEERAARIREEAHRHGRGGDGGGNGSGWGGVGLPRRGWPVRGMGPNPCIFWSVIVNMVLVASILYIAVFEIAPAIALPLSFLFTSVFLFFITIINITGIYITTRNFCIYAVLYLVVSFVISFTTVEYGNIDFVAAQILSLTAGPFVILSGTLLCSSAYSRGANGG